MSRETRYSPSPSRHAEPRRSPENAADAAVLAILRDAAGAATNEASPPRSARAPVPESRLSPAWLAEGLAASLRK
jgi:hypothetical protein